MKENTQSSEKYSFIILSSLSEADLKPYYFSSIEGKAFYSEGLVVKVIPELAETWIGNFQFGDVKYSAVITFPNPDYICVIAKGQGYLVNVNQPLDCQRLSVYPIDQTIPILEKGIVLFVSFTDIVAYNKDGIVWNTGRIALDGIQITQVNSTKITGQVWSPTQNKDLDFSVDIDTGEYFGKKYLD